ncbi:hypothetical protein HHI36_004581, partial [Cryptolaemus montrouzieri]
PSEDDKMLSCTPNINPSIKASDSITFQDVMSKLNSIENKYDMLLSKFDLLVKENTSLKSELTFVKNEFEILKKGTLNSEEVISEINDRSSRARNVILLDVKESAHVNLNDRIAEDMKEVAQLLAGIVSTDIMKVLRVGKKDNRSRPTKVVQSSADVALKVLKNKTVIRNACKSKFVTFR